MFNKIVMSMALIRLTSGSIEIMAALLMLRLNQVEKAMMVNFGLAFVGPIVLITTTALGIAGIADKLSWGKIAWIFAGVVCLLVGILKK